MKMIFLLGILFMIASCSSDKTQIPQSYRPVVIASDEVAVVTDSDSASFIINIPASDTTFTIKNVASRGMFFGSVCVKQKGMENYELAGYGKERYRFHFKDWYSFVELKDKERKIQCHIFPNKTGLPRSIQLSMSDGDYFASVYINQSAENK